MSADEPDEDKPTQGFEEAMKELEQVVDALEKGELTLDQSLDAFERGIKLTRTCELALDAAEQRVRVLTDRSTGAVLARFDPNA